VLSAHPLLLSGRSPGKWHALLFCFFARRRTAPESVHHTRGVLWGCLIGSRAVYLQHSMPIPQMWSGLPRYFPLGAHDWGQVLMFEGKSCSHVGSFTSYLVHIIACPVSQKSITCPRSQRSTSAPALQAQKPRLVRWGDLCPFIL